MRRAYSVAAIQGLWPTQQIVNAVRTSIALAYRRTIPMLLGFSGRFADLGVLCSCESQKVKSCAQDSQASQNTLDMCERQIPVVSLTEMKNCNSNCFGISKNSSEIRSIDP